MNTAFSSDSVSGTFSRSVRGRAVADQDRIGEAARLHQVFLEHLAHRFIATAAIDALAARHMMRHDNPIAFGEFGHTLAERNHRADELMPEHAAGLGDPLSSV